MKAVSLALSALVQHEAEILGGLWTTQARMGRRYAP